MELTEILIIVIPPIAGIVGFLVKYLVDVLTERRRRIFMEELGAIEYKLKEFYYPIKVNLSKERTIWKKVVSRYTETQDNVLILMELNEEILSIHTDNQKIIREKMVNIDPPVELRELIKQYIEHITIYKVLNKLDKLDIDNTVRLRYPSQFQSPYPDELCEFITDRVLVLTEEQTKLKRAFNCESNCCIGDVEEPFSCEDKRINSKTGERFSFYRRGGILTEDVLTEPTNSDPPTEDSD